MTPLTLEEIAALAGVSRSTVSRAINQQPRVSAEVRERVQHIMACTGYAPNTAAQLLAQRRLPLIAIVVTEPTEALFGNPQLARLLGDIATTCQFNRCMCVLYLFSGTDLPAALHAPQIDGVMVVGGPAGDGPAVGGPTDRVVAQLRGRGLPSIVIDRFSPPDHPDLAATIQHLLPPRTPRGSSNA